MTNWQSNLDEATSAYSRSLLSGALLSATERASSAREFRDWIEYFQSGGEASRTVLETEMRGADHNRVFTAARLFIECGDAHSLAQLSQNVTEFRGWITWPDLKRLWIKA